LVAPGIGSSFGQNAGASVSRILGFGDYKVSQNTLTSSPQFGKSSNEIRVRKREFVKNITGSTAFTNEAFTVNPGNQGLFPWLTGIAQCYQQYRVNGMVFYFNSTSATALNSTNTALGTVMMASNYDLIEPDYDGKQEMLASYFSNSCKPSEDMIHAIECDMKQRPVDVLYIDHNGESSSDPSLFNLCNFQLATEGMQASAVIGELWVSYDITFYKPRRPEPYSYSYVDNAAWDINNPFGIVQRTQRGKDLDIGGSGGYDTIYLDQYASQRVLVQICLMGSSLSSPSFTPTIVNLTEVNAYKAATISDFGPTNTSTVHIYLVCYDVPSNQSTRSSLQYASGALTSGTPSGVYVLVSAVQTW